MVDLILSMHYNVLIALFHQLLESDVLVMFVIDYEDTTVPFMLANERVQNEGVPNIFHRQDSDEPELLEHVSIFVALRKRHLIRPRGVRRGYPACKL